MAQFTGQNMCDEIAFRLGGRGGAANAAGAGSILQYLNMMHLLIDSSASWRWTLSFSSGLTPDTAGHLPPNKFGQMNPGKKVSVFNSSDQSPVSMVDQDSYPASAQGYTGVNATSYNTFRVAVEAFGGNNLGALWLYPALASPVNVDVYYHTVVLALAYGSFPAEWPYSEMDDLLMDWTEAKMKRVLGMAGWDTLWADCLGRLAEMRKIYTTERENIGPQDEATSDRVKKNKVGRA